jgi:hypothetical protein
VARMLLGAAVSSLLLGLLPSDASAQSPGPAVELPADSHALIEAVHRHFDQTLASAL